MKKRAEYPGTINMNRLIFLLFSLCFIPGASKAQDRPDSLIAVNPDSTWLFEDTLNQRTVVVNFENEKLTAIHYLKWLPCGGTEQVTFYIANDSLVSVHYKISDPDIRSSFPPSITYFLSFKMDKQIGQDTHLNFVGPTTCTGFSVTDKDFIKEFYYYKDLVYSDEK